jgi:hypothetical protein
MSTMFRREQRKLSQSEAETVQGIREVAQELYDRIDMIRPIPRNRLGESEIGRMRDVGGEGGISSGIALLRWSPLIGSEIGWRHSLRCRRRCRRSGPIADLRIH